MRKPRDQWGDARLIRAVHECFDGVLYHLADESNACSIDSHGLLSSIEMAARGIRPAVTGGSPLTRALDERDGLRDHVFLSFFQSVLMPKDDEIDRHRSPLLLAIKPEILFKKGVEVRLGRSASAPRFGAMRAIYEMDTEIWDNPELRQNPFGGRARWNTFLNYEVLVPKCVPRDYILGVVEQH